MLNFMTTGHQYWLGQFGVTKIADCTWSFFSLCRTCGINCQGGWRKRPFWFQSCWKASVASASGSGWRPQYLFVRLFSLETKACILSLPIGAPVVGRIGEVVSIRITVLSDDLTYPPLYPWFQQCDDISLGDGVGWSVLESLERDLEGKMRLFPRLHRIFQSGRIVGVYVWILFPSKSFACSWSANRMIFSSRTLIELSLSSLDQKPAVSKCFETTPRLESDASQWMIRSGWCCLSVDFSGRPFLAEALFGYLG